MPNDETSWMTIPQLINFFNERVNYQNVKKYHVTETFHNSAVRYYEVNNLTMEYENGIIISDDINGIFQIHDELELYSFVESSIFELVKCDNKITIVLRSGYIEVEIEY